MKKKFPLAVLLALREQKEQIEEKTLAQTNAELIEVRQVLHRLAEQQRRDAELRVGQIASVRAAAEHLSWEARWKELRNVESQLEAKLGALEVKRSVELEKYVQARCERETLTELRNGHEKRWEADERLREQKAIGDMFNAKRRKRSHT